MERAQPHTWHFLRQMMSTSIPTPVSQTMIIRRGETVGDEPSPEKVHTAQELPISRAVFIDSTWNQSRGIYKDQRLRALPCVVLESRVSQFWRHQKNSPRWYLATVEAVYQLLVELHTATTKDEEYQGQYDNLLFLFHYMYSKIHDLYKHEDLQAYKRPLK
uniref:tRNA-uridine aminocarboxypropyltransferase 1 n=1 Tax=Timema tahoe TaxID=61484 RepID=A0A7R9IDD1_9NEOP|nr:unnamed protein product [Timema tahoe]